MSSEIDLKYLAMQWILFKDQEQSANRKRLETEKKILELMPDIADKGTTYINQDDTEDPTLKITTGFDVAWDQDILWEVMRVWTEAVDGVAFPFHQELKPDSKVMALIRERMQ